jgi:adenylate kinase family enzyme
MKVLLFGNSGSGKSTLAKQYSTTHGLSHLDLDAIVWEPNQIAIQRERVAVVASLDAFLSLHDQWVIEGCYGELVQHASAFCSELIFLNPGLDTCLKHNQARPWEPHKYASKEAQDSMLDHLQAWVTSYYTRDDQWSFAAHRRIFDGFNGPKRQVITSPTS